jgi:hypothetical protein
VAQNSKRSDKGIDSGHVAGTAFGASKTPLKITRPLRSSKARKATSETPQRGLEITAGLCAVIHRLHVATVRYGHSAIGSICILCISALGLNVRICRGQGRSVALGAEPCTRSGQLVPLDWVCLADRAAQAYAWPAEGSAELAGLARS